MRARSFTSRSQHSCLGIFCIMLRNATGFRERLVCRLPLTPFRAAARAPRGSACPRLPLWEGGGRILFSGLSWIFFCFL